MDTGDVGGKYVMHLTGLQVRVDHSKRYQPHDGDDGCNNHPPRHERGRFLARLIRFPFFLGLSLIHI